MSKPSVLAEPLLVGREKELERLREFLSSTIRGKGKTVFVSGEAGAGKTRLMKEFLCTAKNRGIAVLTGWCLSNAAVPYFPFFEAFGHFFIGEQTGDENTSDFSNLHATPKEIDLASWLPELGQSQKWGLSEAISPQVWKDQTFAAVSRTLGPIAQNQTVILFLDDIQWADSASLALVHYLARSVSLERVLLIATFRSENLTVDTEARAERPDDCILELYVSCKELTLSEIKYPSGNKKCTLISRIIVLGNLKSKLSVEKASDELKETAERKEAENPYTSISSAYRIS